MGEEAIGKIHMPLTFPAHQGLILPVARRWPGYFDALALSVGATMPDITDSMLGFLLNGYFKQWYGHSLIGIFTLDLLGGLLITSLITVFATRLRYANVSQCLQTFFSKVPAQSHSVGRNIVLRWWIRLSLWSFSVLVGILSHVGFDLISHNTNLLLYPWHENARWFPGWWYTTWFEIRPLPMFGHSYSVGLFTVIWCILSLFGIYLFFRFLSPKDENRVWIFWEMSILQIVHCPTQPRFARRSCDSLRRAPDPSTGSGTAGGTRRVFTCACGKVQAGSLLGLKLVPSKWRCLIPPQAANASRWALIKGLKPEPF